MSLIHHIDHIARAPGVLSIRVCVPGQIDHRGDHEEALRLAMLTRDELNVDRTSTAAGDITIMVQREPGGTAAVAVVTGHEIRKSLRRMIKRCAKPDKAPTVEQLLRGHPAQIPEYSAGDHVPGVKFKHECRGHMPGPYDPMGETVYCDGSCRNT